MIIEQLKAVTEKLILDAEAEINYLSGRLNTDEYRAFLRGMLAGYKVILHTLIDMEP